MTDTVSEAEEPAGAPMTFWEHLDEFRSRLIKSMIAVAIGTAVVISLWGPVSDFFLRPYCDALDALGRTEPCSLVITDPLEGFRTRLRVGFTGGIALAMPVILWQLWQFIHPALKPSEKRWTLPFVISGVVLFVAGVSLGFWTFPRALEFFINVGGSNISPLFTPDKYFSLITFLMLSFGVGFEFPIVLIFLQLAGVVNADTLARGRRYAAVGIVTLAAIITPTGDPITLGALSIPLYIFYEAAIVIGRFLVRRRAGLPGFRRGRLFRRSGSDRS